MSLSNLIFYYSSKIFLVSLSVLANVFTQFFQLCVTFVRAFDLTFDSVADDLGGLFCGLFHGGRPPPKYFILGGV